MVVVLDEALACDRVGELRLAAMKPGNVCAYIYTSGTTGQATVWLCGRQLAHWVGG